MPCPDSDSAAAALGAALTGPSEVSVDGVTVIQQPLGALIAAHKYLAGVCAAKTRHRGVRFNRLIPDGTVHRRHFAPSPSNGWGFDRWRDV